ncbi:DUF3164 family protein [Burkholderia glumae]|uniref:DUF3164 family protein n=1 Tax=Burkholderia glumae TaxID=337 RepID=UPI0021513046|nr:DUF3164 family protein [Burkholderia glumae]
MNRGASGPVLPRQRQQEKERQNQRVTKSYPHRNRCTTLSRGGSDLDEIGGLRLGGNQHAEQYGTKLGGRKGNVTLYSFDGRYRIQRAIQDRIAFDERLQAAKAMIDECLRDWTSDARPEIQAIVTQAFATDKEGQINTGRVLALRRLDITDPRWLEAMRAIGEALQVIGSKSYVRVYERVGDTDQYVQIPLDIANA